MKKLPGYTVIELLIVMAIVAMLVIAAIALLDPIEQMKKARDKRILADARELLVSYDRYLAGYQKWPWSEPSVIINDTSLPSSTTEINPDFNLDQDHYFLIERNELRANFLEKDTIKNNELMMSISAYGVPNLCFEPESRAARSGGIGPIKTELNELPSSPDCDAPYGASSQCFVCLPF